MSLSLCILTNPLSACSKSEEKDDDDDDDEEKDSKSVSCYLTCPGKTKDCDMGDLEVASVCSICETSRESVASDLTRMCVSDEDDRSDKMICS